MSNLISKRSLSLLVLTSMFVLFAMATQFSGSINLVGSADLVANYGLPYWAAAAISAGLNTAGTLAAVIAVLGTFGLGAVAAVVWNYVKKYGVSYAVSW